jgi:hypothetical protein
MKEDYTYLKILFIVFIVGAGYLNSNSKNSSRENNSGKNTGDISAFFSTNTDFSSVEQCIQYARDNSLTMEKLKAGVISCRAIFYADDNIEKKNKISQLIYKGCQLLQPELNRRSRRNRQCPLNHRS